MLHLTASSCTPLNNYFAMERDSPGDKLKIIHASGDAAMYALVKRALQLWRN